MLIQLGEFDALFPASGAAEEAAQWTNPNVQLEVQALTDIGHNFNLHLNREQSWQGIDRWLRGTLQP